MIGKSVVWSVLASILVIALADYRLPGGETTVFDASREAFTQPARTISILEISPASFMRHSFQYKLGKRFIRSRWARRARALV